MNFSKSIFLINNNVRAVTAIYEEGGKPAVFKTMDPMIAVGDFVVVPTDTRLKMTVCRVTEVDVDVDFDDSIQMTWVIATLDLDEYNLLLKQEAQAITAIKSAEVRQKREALRSALFADHMDTLKALPIAAMEDGAAPKA